MEPTSREVGDHFSAGTVEDGGGGDSVKAIGDAPPSLPRPGITFCDTKSCASSAFSSNMKSAGKRSGLRRTACLRARVSTA